MFEVKKQIRVRTYTGVSGYSISKNRKQINIFIDIRFAKHDITSASSFAVFRLGHAVIIHYIIINYNII